MKYLAKYFKEEENLWQITGMVHDIDYEKSPDKHPLEGLKILEKKGYSKEVVGAVAAHAWGYRDGLPKPKNKMEWSLYCCDELTGFIVACALVRPVTLSKTAEGHVSRLQGLTIESILKKWNQKAFASGVNRKQIENCEKELGIPLSEFIGISLKAMQEIHEDLGL